MGYAINPSWSLEMVENSFQTSSRKYDHNGLKSENGLSTSSYGHFDGVSMDQQMWRYPISDKP